MHDIDGFLFTQKSFGRTIITPKHFTCSVDAANKRSAFVYGALSVFYVRTKAVIFISAHRITLAWRKLNHIGATFYAVLFAY